MTAARFPLMLLERRRPFPIPSTRHTIVQRSAPLGASARLETPSRSGGAAGCRRHAQMGGTDDEGQAHADDCDGDLISQCPERQSTNGPGQERREVLGGLSFAEFKGYETWGFISLSQGDQAVTAILGNPEMINAYKQGYPGNGKPFPDGAKMAKVHWIPKKSATAPAPTTIPGTLHDVDFMVKDSKRFGGQRRVGIRRVQL